MKNLRNKIEKTAIKLANLLQNKGIFNTIQYYLFGKGKSVCPNECKW